MLRTSQSRGRVPREGSVAIGKRTVDDRTAAASNQFDAAWGLVATASSQVTRERVCPSLSKRRCSLRNLGGCWCVVSEGVGGGGAPLRLPVLGPGVTPGDVQGQKRSEDSCLRAARANVSSRSEVAARTTAAGV
jgi:hypothetical protein